MQKPMEILNPLSDNPTKWSNTLKLRLSVFYHVVGLALKGLRIWKITSASDQPIFVQWERFEAEKVMTCKSCQVCKSAENYTTWQNEKKKKNHNRNNSPSLKKSGAIFSVCTCEQKLN